MIKKWHQTGHVSHAVGNFLLNLATKFARLSVSGLNASGSAELNLRIMIALQDA